MSYEVKVIYGGASKDVQLENVSTILLTEGIYFLYDSDGDILFTSPKEFVVYINKK